MLHCSVSISMQYTTVNFGRFYWTYKKKERESIYAFVIELSIRVYWARLTKIQHLTKCLPEFQSHYYSARDNREPRSLVYTSSLVVIIKNVCFIIGIDGCGFFFRREGGKTKKKNRKKNISFNSKCLILRRKWCIRSLPYFTECWRPGNFGKPNRRTNRRYNFSLEPHYLEECNTFWTFKELIRFNLRSRHFNVELLEQHLWYKWFSFLELCKRLKMTC